MIITIDDIRNVRPIAYNIDEARVNMYIREAEILDVLPILGADLHENLSNADNLTPEEDMLLNGGYFNDGCGKKKFEGLKSAISYFAYARFLRNNQINVTPYGVVTKLGEESATSDYKAVAAQAAEAENIGKVMLAEAMRYWNNVAGNCSCGKKQIQKRKFHAIGK